MKVPRTEGLEPINRPRMSKAYPPDLGGCPILDFSKPSQQNTRRDPQLDGHASDPGSIRTNHSNSALNNNNLKKYDPVVARLSQGHFLVYWYSASCSEKPVNRPNLRISRLPRPQTHIRSPLDTV